MGPIFKACPHICANILNIPQDWKQFLSSTFRMKLYCLSSTASLSGPLFCLPALVLLRTVPKGRLQRGQPVRAPRFWMVWLLGRRWMVEGPLGSLELMRFVYSMPCPYCLPLSLWMLPVPESICWCSVGNRPEYTGLYMEQPRTHDKKKVADKYLSSVALWRCFLYSLPEFPSGIEPLLPRSVTCSLKHLLFEIPFIGCLPITVPFPFLSALFP